MLVIQNAASYKESWRMTVLSFIPKQANTKHSIDNFELNLNLELLGMLAVLSSTLASWRSRDFLSVEYHDFSTAPPLTMALFLSFLIHKCCGQGVEDRSHAFSPPAL